MFKMRIEAIRSQCVEFYSAEQVQIWTSGNITEKFVQAVERSFYVSEIDGHVVGSGMIDRMTGFIDAIFVLPEFMGKGAAKAMLKHLEIIALRQNLSCVSLQSTLNAAGFYRAHGYDGTETSVYHSPLGVELDCVPMRKWL
ncbi:hypothetical protein VMF7928_01994 [Vibrio marisflavi CECT 7928]|uniref:N-acetyltransferase domain-containing protein n=1 Tax=Vibrio marisflavi CECT 7928 TaxID=634439 RepID=A0ABN8E298_9VIBR|nr:hypothetical protein VMF7928_01994 [Vibrio marisflavi CECT 7928]